MKKIKDIFSYSVGHGAIGISCSHKCKYFTYLNKQRKCIKHNVLLDIMLNDNGYVKGEWFCKNFEDSGDTHSIGIIEFNQIKDKLEDNILYEACGKEYLCMIPFDKLRE